MSNLPTDYHRLVVVVPKPHKTAICAWAHENGYTLTSVIRQALKEFFHKRGVIIS